MLFLEIQRGKVEMPKWSSQYRELGATTSCSIRATIKTSNCGQKIDEHRRNLILATHGSPLSKLLRLFMKLDMNGLVLLKPPTAFTQNNILKIR
jgi:hypothetical protein